MGVSPVPYTSGNDLLDQHLQQACAELEEAFHAGKDARAERWLRKFPLLAGDPQAVVSLAYWEFTLREALGQAPAPEEYYERFPGGRRELEEQFQIHAFLREACTPGEPPRPPDPLPLSALITPSGKIFPSPERQRRVPSLALRASGEDLSCRSNNQPAPVVPRNTSPPTPRADRPWRWARRHSLLVALLGMIGAAFFLLVGRPGYIAGPEQERKTRAPADPENRASLGNGKDRGGSANPELVPGEPERFSALAGARDGKMLATATPDGRVQLRDGATLAERATLRAHRGAILALAFSADGRFLATGGADGGATLWDVARRQRLARLGGRGRPVRAVAFSPDGRHLALTGDEGAVQVWDARAYRQAAGFPGHGSDLLAIAFSPDGRALAAGYEDGQVKIFDTRTRRERTTRAEHRGPVRITRFSPDGRTLATGGLDRTVRLWDFPGMTTRVTLGWKEGYPVAAAFSPDSRTLAVGGGNRREACSRGPVQVWDVATGQLRATLPGQAGLVGFAADGRSLITAAGRRLQVWVAKLPPPGP